MTHADGEADRHKLCITLTEVA